MTNENKALLSVFDESIAFLRRKVVDTLEAATDAPGHGEVCIESGPVETDETKVDLMVAFMWGRMAADLHLAISALREQVWPQSHRIVPETIRTTKQ